MEKKEIKGHLEFLSNCEMGQAVRERLEELIRECENISSISDEIMTKDSLTISSNLIGRKEAAKILRDFIKEITPPKKIEGKKKTHV